MVYYFYGVQINENRMAGYISSDELIDGFRKSWFPYYQRQRVNKKKKIRELIDIYKSGKPIDSVKLNLIGTHSLEGETEALLDGTFHVIDGQQRLTALKESGVRNLRIPVELYLNLPMEKENELFNQFNRKQTPLTFGDLVKGADSAYGDMIRKTLTNTSLPIPVVVNGNASGIGLSLFGPLLYFIHRKIETKTLVEHYLLGNRLIDFFLRDHNKDSILLVEYAAKNVLKTYEGLFGAYDPKASCYKRAFFLPCVHVLTNYFLKSDGKLDFGKFDAKVRALPAMLRNSRIKEIISSKGGDSSADTMYHAILDHLNHKLKGGHLPTFMELRQEKNMVNIGIITRNETYVQNAMRPD